MLRSITAAALLVCLQSAPAFAQETMMTVTAGSAAVYKSPSTGSPVIGHAPRQLDRNIAVVGRVIEGIEHLATLPRGKGEAGVYDEWAEERRGFYTEQAGRVLAALAKLSLSEKRWADALKFAGEVLRDDPYREDMHRLTMKILAAQGKPAAVKKHFENLKQLMHDELGIQPASETQRLYRELSS